MKKYSLLLVFMILLNACGVSKKTSNPVTKDRPSVVVSEKKTSKRSTKKGVEKEIIKETSIATSEEKAFKIIDYAKTFEGTRYKFGGIDKNGMDCSGLVYTSFKKENITLPRISRDMATQGVSIKLKETEEGDLVFFQTNKKRRIINHVGLVVENKKGEIFFIHSTTSKGVIISSLEEPYWKNAFVEVRRII
ncbi:MAG: C40 family peptidase [Flavobacteriaceae bacterium]